MQTLTSWAPISRTTWQWRQGCDHLITYYFLICLLNTPKHHYIRCPVTQEREVLFKERSTNPKHSHGEL